MSFWRFSKRQSLLFETWLRVVTISTQRWNWWTMLSLSSIKNSVVLVSLNNFARESQTLSSSPSAKLRKNSNSWLITLSQQWFSSHHQATMRSIRSSSISFLLIISKKIKYYERSNLIIFIKDGPLITFPPNKKSSLNLDSWWQTWLKWTDQKT